MCTRGECYGATSIEKPCGRRVEVAACKIRLLSVGFGEDQGTPQKKYDFPSRSSVLTPSLPVQLASHSAFDHSILTYPDIRIPRIGRVCLPA